MSVCIEWMKQISSTHSATWGKMSLTHLPQSPYCLNPKGDGIKPFRMARHENQHRVRQTLPQQPMGLQHLVFFTLVGAGRDPYGPTG